jgi:acetyltransferase-like isoleucine patch superfamily enzyme
MVCRIRDKLFTLAIKRSFGEVGRRTVIRLPVRIKGERHIEIGGGVTVAAGSWLLAIERDGQPPPRLRIGDRTSIAGSCVISAATDVRLGNAVLLAGHVYIADHSHAYADPSRPILDQGIEQVAAVEICDGAWLGQNVVVCPGVRIGAGAVVAANSVVKDDVPDYCVAAGAPARIVRCFAGDESGSARGRVVA